MESTWESRVPALQKYLDKGYDYGTIANILGVSRKNLRNRISELRQKGLLRASSHNPSPKDIPIKGYKETIEIAPDGTHKSDKLLRMSEQQSKDVNYLLKAHGYDKDMWELVSAKNNIWNVYSKQDGIQTLYSSKITVKPKTQGWTFEELLEAIREDVCPVHIHVDIVDVTDKRMLEIPFYDMHWGISDFDQYRRTQWDTYNLITSKRWEEILFIIGQDLLHNNDFTGKTANGTQIEIVDMPKAWRDARAFYVGLIEAAIPNSNHVKIIYSRGNHDEAMSWAFVQMLMERYPQVEFEDSLEDRKVHTFGRIFLGITHGDEARRDLEGIFPQEFPLEWARTTYRELHHGHLHREEAIDHFGLMSRTLSTRNKTDKWHKRKGYVTAQKRFMLFEYTTEELKHIHYV